MPPPRGRPPAMKALATQAYTMGNMSFCSIARLFGVSDVAVLKWKRGKTRELPERKVESEQVNLMLDEMWHFIQKKTCRLRIWRAYDPVARRTVAWVVGGGDDETCQKLLDKIGVEGKTFITDDWDGYHRLIKERTLHRQGFDRSCFPRRTKVVSKSQQMVDLSLRLYYHHHNLEALAEKLSAFQAIFG